MFLDLVVCLLDVRKMRNRFLGHVFLSLIQFFRNSNTYDPWYLKFCKALRWLSMHTDSLISFSLFIHCLLQIHFLNVHAKWLFVINNNYLKYFIICCVSYIFYLRQFISWTTILLLKRIQFNSNGKTTIGTGMMSVTFETYFFELAFIFSMKI